MQLTHEETLRRIEQYEQDAILGYKFCKKVSYPYLIRIYKGEGKLVVVPLITTVGWVSAEMDWFLQISLASDAETIGASVLKAIEHIQVSPVDARTNQERDEDALYRKVSTCKTYKNFEKKFYYCTVRYNEDGTYRVSQVRPTKRRGNGNYDFTPIDLQPSANAREIGDALLRSFVELEDYLKIKSEKVELPRTSFELLSDNHISFVAPPEDVYTDEQDFHAAEIYQGYSYYKKGKDDSVADMYFACASELDCDTTPEHIQRVYESYDGSASSFVCEEAEHPVFEQRIEMKTASVHRIVYVKRISECELLSCELVIKVRLAGQRLHDKIVKDFEAMVSSCRAER